jgi:hypothetical protein
MGYEDIFLPNYAEIASPETMNAQSTDARRPRRCLFPEIPNSLPLGFVMMVDTLTSLRLECPGRGGTAFHEVRCASMSGFVIGMEAQNRPPRSRRAYDRFGQSVRSSR